MYPTIKEAEKSSQAHVTENIFQKHQAALYRKITTFVSDEHHRDSQLNRDYELKARQGIISDMHFNGIWFDAQPQNTDALVSFYLGVEKQHPIERLLNIPRPALIIIQVILPDYTFDRIHLLSKNDTRIWNNEEYQGKLNPSVPYDFDYLKYLRGDIDDLLAHPDIQHRSK